MWPIKNWNAFCKTAHVHLKACANAIWNMQQKGFWNYISTCNIRVGWFCYFFIFISYLNYYLSFDVCARFRLSVCVCLRLSVCVCELFNGCIYQRMLVHKVGTFLKRIKMAVLFLIFLDQICPKWIKLDQTWSCWISH